MNQEHEDERPRWLDLDSAYTDEDAESTEELWSGPKLIGAWIVLGLISALLAVGGFWVLVHVFLWLVR